DGERDDLKPHLAHIIGAGRAHAVADHLRLLDDFFNRQLTDDAAQVAFHYQLNQALTFLRTFGEELLRRSPDGFRVGFDFDLSDSFDSNRDALLGVQVLLRSNVERHQLERQAVTVFQHGEHNGSVAGDHALAAESVHYNRFMWASLAIEPGHGAHQKQKDHYAESGEDPNFHPD